MLAIGTIIGHDNWPTFGRFWPVAWVVVTVLVLGPNFATSNQKFLLNTLLLSNKVTPRPFYNFSDGCLSPNVAMNYTSMLKVKISTN
jgi:hypothetical protein